MYKRFDVGAIRLIENFCQQIEKISGKTSYFFLEILTGIYAIFLAIFLFVIQLYLRTGTARHTILIGGMMVSFFVISFWYAPSAHAKAVSRRQDGFQNPAKQSRVHFLFRLVMLLNAILPVVVLLLLYALNGAFAISVPVMSYVLTTFCSFVLFWVCFLLDACDLFHKKTPH